MAAVAVHLQAGRVCGAAVADDGEVLDRHREDYPLAPRSSSLHDDELTAAVVATVRALRARGQRATVGVAFETGVGDARRVQQALEHVQEQVHVETAARAAAWGEHRLGVLRGNQAPQNSMTVTVGASICGGLILRGRLVRGAQGRAGEIGHLPFVPGGRQCECGLEGCLDRYASAAALVERTRAAQIESAEGGPRLALDVRNAPVDEVASEIVRDARNGNELALGQTAEIGRHLGMGIGRLVKPLSLSEVVLRGSVVDDAGDILLTPAREAMSRTVGQSTDLELRAGLPGDDAVLLGVTDLSLNSH